MAADRGRLPSSLLSQPRTARTSARRSSRRRLAAIVVTVLVALSAGALLLRAGRLEIPSQLGAGSKRASDQSGQASRATGPAPSTPTTGSVSESAEGQQASSTVATATREIQIGWVGDLTPGSKYGNQPRDGKALFEPTRKLTVKPDIMVANLEGTFGEGGPSKCDGIDSALCYAFQAPPRNARSLAWAGFDVVNLANNHSRDYLGPGLESTRKALKENGVSYTGLSETPIAIEEANGVRVAFLGFSPYAWSPSIADLEGAKALVREADRGADIVVVIIHAGAEGADKTRTPKGAETAYGEFRGDSRAFSHAVIDAGADLVLGSGPHVVRGMERYKGRLVAYSLGNFAGWNNFSRAGKLALSGLLSVRLADDGRVLDGRWHSLRITGPGVPQPDPSHEAARLVRRLSEQDFEDPVALEDDGSFVFPNR